MRLTTKLHAVRSLLFVALLLCAAAAAVGCSPTTKIVNSWKDPSVAGPLKFKKVLVIVIHPDAHTRGIAEDELVRQIGADRAIRGDQVLTDEDRADRNKLKAKVKQSGVDGVVTMRVAGATTNTAWSRGFDSYAYDSFWQDYDRNISAGDSSVGAMHTERVISIRTSIFSVADEKLVWSGVSESFDPTNTRALIDDIAKAVGARLREEHVIE